MEFIHGHPFANDHSWTREELAAVTPEEMMRYLKIKIYNNKGAAPDIDPPLKYRSNSVKCWKKSWSYFMPNKMTNWDEINRRGNPTCCAEINKLIKSMIKMEVAKRGMPSQARRSLVPAEFKLLMDKMGHAKETTGIWASAYFAFQYNLIARVDDTAKFRRPDLQPFHAYPDYGITAKLCWAKNCNEERDAPTQIVFGAMDWRYCVLSTLGTWLEHHYTIHPDFDNEFFFDLGGTGDPDAIKESASYHFRLVLHDEDMQEITVVTLGLTGTHSIRKYAVNAARGNGCRKDDTDCRGRWKSGDRQQDTYADTTIPYVDGKVAAALCKGGPIVYVVKESSGATDQWILDHVATHMAESGLPRQACVVLGRAVLWKVFAAQYSEEDEPHGVPASLSERVMAAYRDIGDCCTLPPTENPVGRLPLGVTGVDAQLIVDVIMSDVDYDGSGGIDARGRAGMEREEVRLLSSQVLQLRRELADSRDEATRRDVNTKTALSRLNRNMARLAAFPARRTVAADAAQEEESTTGQDARLAAVLMPRPRTLHDLWKEYQFGGPGRKPAKDFTPEERGRVKVLYSRRRVLWDKICELTRTGVAAQVACDLVYEAYGQNLPVTKILAKMKVDRRTGGWPARLRIRIE